MRYTHHLTNISKYRLEKEGICLRSHSHFIEACSSWQGCCPTSQHRRDPLQSTGEQGKGSIIKQQGTPGDQRGNRQQGGEGTHQFLLQRLFEFQHPLLHLLYGLRQIPTPDKRHSVNAHFTIFKGKDNRTDTLGSPYTCQKSLLCLLRGLCCHLCTCCYGLFSLHGAACTYLLF